MSKRAIRTRRHRSDVGTVRRTTGTYTLTWATRLPRAKCPWCSAGGVLPTGILCPHCEPTVGSPVSGGGLERPERPALEAVALIVHRLRIFLEAENALEPSPVSTAGLRDALEKFDKLPALLAATPTAGQTPGAKGTER